MRSGEAFQVFGEIRRVLFDKTGTLTEGKPRVVEIVPADGGIEEDVLRAAASAEDPSEHPLARAIVQAADERELEYPEADEFESETGQGIRARAGGEEVLVGKPDWLAGHGIALGPLAERREAMEEAAQTVIAVARGGRLLGLVGIADEVKQDAREAVEWLRQAGVESVLITGDNERTARAVAAEVGIEDVRAQVLPQEKAAAVRAIQEEGQRVAFVGDGINDAPALMQADVGIAIGAGTDIAIESSDVVLVGERLTAVAEAREIGAGSFRKTKQNLTIAFLFNGIGVPAAITGYVHPVWAMVAMISSVSTVLLNSFGAPANAGQPAAAAGVRRTARPLGADPRPAAGAPRARRPARPTRARAARCLVRRRHHLGRLGRPHHHAGSRCLMKRWRKLAPHEVDDATRGGSSCSTSFKRPALLAMRSSRGWRRSRVGTRAS